MQSKNALCACGSGKKFKMCCMNKQVIEIQESHFNPIHINTERRELHRIIHSQLFENIQEQHQVMAEADIPKGLRSLVLYRMYQVLKELNTSEPNDKKIKAYLAEVYWIFYNGKKNYKEIIQIIAKLSDIKQTMAVENEHLSDAAVEIIYERTVGAILLDYALKTLDYGIFRVCIQFCIQFLQIPNNQIPAFNHVRLFVESGDELQDFELLQTSSPFPDIYYEMIANDIMYNELQSAKLNYKGFSENSLKTIATAIASEKTLNTDPNYISYTGMCMSYFGVIEDELRRLVYTTTPNLQNKKIMWAELTRILAQIKLPILEQACPEYIEQMKKLNPLRNLAAHGEHISMDQFANLKEFLFEGNFLTYLSWQVNGEIPAKMLDNLIEGTIDVTKNNISINKGSLIKSNQDKKKVHSIRNKMEHEVLLKQYENEVFTLFKLPQKTLKLSIQDILNEKAIQQILKTHHEADLAFYELARDIEQFDLLRAYCATLNRAGLLLVNLVLGECLIQKGNAEEVQEGINILEKLGNAGDKTAINYLLLYYGRMMEIETDEDQALQTEKVKYYSNRQVQLGNDLGYLQLAEICLYQKQHKEAYEFAKKALNTKHPMAYQMMGKVLLAMEQNIDQAIDYLKKSLAQQAHYSTALLLGKAALHATIRDIDLAEQSLYQSMDLFKIDGFMNISNHSIDFEDLVEEIKKHKSLDSSIIQKIKAIQAELLQNN